MFAEVADMTCLRQGDIIDGIPFPRLSSPDMLILGKVPPDASQPQVPQLAAHTTTHRDDQNWLLAQIPVRLSFCAVISQCCDLEPKHGQLLMPAFAVARLIPIPKAILNDQQRLASLRSNKDPRRGSDPGYLNFFYIPQHEKLDRKEWVVDYNQTTAIPVREFPAILSKKVLQMEDQWRVKFKIKMAICLARITDEEQKARLEDPWAQK